VGALSVVVFWLCCASMREPAETDAAPGKLDFPAEVAVFTAMARHNGPLIRIFVLITVASIALSMFGKNLLYFFKYNLQAPDYAPIALLMPAVMMFIAAPFWVWLARKFSKRTAAIGCLSLGALGYLGFYLNPSLDPRVSIAIITFIGFGGAGFAVMFWAMLPDTVEYGEARTGLRHEAKVFGFASFAQKAALGVNALLLGWLLQSTGYVANADQTQETLAGLKAIMALIPMCGALAGIWILWGYPITARYHEELVAQIAANRIKQQEAGG
jgi:GPH family glycoside/pentoside/hexuronide:cation symporter